MLCPICNRTQFVRSSGETHYICVKKENLPREETGCGTQFVVGYDKHLRFPYNVIFKKRPIHKFYRYDHLAIKKVDND